MSDMTASTSMSHHEAAASIVAAARTSLPDLVERVAHRIRTEIPCYAAEDVVAPADLRASVRANIDYILDSLTGRARANLSAPDATGRARAGRRRGAVLPPQHRPLPAAPHRGRHRPGPRQPW